MRYLTEKMRKRDMAANAVLAAGLIGNLQSPQHFVRSGHIEAPGVQLMQRMMKKRKEANRNLDSGVVSQGARNRSNVSSPSTSQRMSAAYDRMKKQKREKADEIIRDLRKEQKTFQDFMLECYELGEGYKERPIKKMMKKAMDIVNRSDYEGSSEDVWRHNQIIKHTLKKKGGGKQRKKAQHNIDKYWDRLDREDELEESSSNKDKLLNAIARRVHNAPNRKERQKWKDIESKHRSRFTPPRKKLWRKGLTQADREYANQQDYDDLDTFGTKSTLDPGAGVSHITKNQRKLRKQKAMGEHPNESFEYELEESSMGERSGRRTRGNLTLARGRGADMHRSERTTAAIAKKAGMKGTGKFSTKDLKSLGRDYTTYDSEDIDDDFGSTEQDHYIRTYKSPRRAAKGERLINKFKPAGKTPSGMTKLKTASSSDSVRKVKDLRKSMTKVGANKRGRVHSVDIMHRDENIGKGDKTQQMERGRNFIQAIKDTPKHLKRAGAEKGDTVIGKPTAVMSGEDPKTGAEKRGKLYKKVFGKKSSERSPKTGLMTGKVD